MPWVKIDAAAPTHPKHLQAGPLASWLWVAGLCYCHRHHTDGFLPVAPLSSLCPLRYASVSARRLVAVGLWEVVEGGWRVHDYGKFQQSKAAIEQNQEHIHAVRAEAGRLGMKTRWAGHTKKTGNKSNKALTNENAIAEQSISTLPKEQEEKTAPRQGRKRPLFTGQRLVVFEWMLDELMRTLGTAADAFDLHEWFFEADRRAMAESVVNADWWPWLKAQTLTEARQRGFVVALPAAMLGKQSTRMAQMLANIADDEDGASS